MNFPTNAQFNPRIRRKAVELIRKAEVKSTSLDYFYCGTFGGFCSVLVGHPFDTVKVRMHTDKLGFTTIQTFRSIWATDGIRGFYRGISAPIVSMSPIIGMSFMGYKLGKNAVASFFGRETYQFIPSDFFLAGAFSGVFGTLITVPGEQIKCLMQVQQNNTKVPYKTPLRLLKELYKENGVQSLYRGCGATILRDVPATSAYFGIYELSLRFFAGELGLDYCSPRALLLSMLSGGLAGMVFWTVGMPADMLKNRVQTAPLGRYPNGMRDALRDLMKRKNVGPLVLFTGLMPVLVFSFPTNAVIFLGYEVMRSFILYRKGIQKCSD